MPPPTVSHSRESRHWRFRPTPAGGIWLRCILPFKNGYSADKRHFASRDTRDAIFVKNKCRNTRERYLSMRAAFGKAARSNPHWYEIPVSEVVREYASALADRSGQANTFTNLIAISWAGWLWRRDVRRYVCLEIRMPLGAAEPRVAPQRPPESAVQRSHV